MSIFDDFKRKCRYIKLCKDNIEHHHREIEYWLKVKDNTFIERRIGMIYGTLSSYKLEELSVKFKMAEFYVDYHFKEMGYWIEEYYYIETLHV